MDILNITSGQLRKAANLQERIESLQSQLNELLDGKAKPQNLAPATQGKRKLSAAGRARIAAAARARWAKLRGSAPAKTTSKPKRQMSAAAKARLSALAKARWKKAKAAGKATL